MIVIDGRIFINILIDGQPIPSTPNLVSKIALAEGNGALAPAGELILNDIRGSLGRELALTDGNHITVTVGKSPEDVKTVTRQYRLFGTRQITTGFGPQIKVVLLYDAPAYTTEAVREVYTGSSEDVLRQVAEKCRLGFKGPTAFNSGSTRDSQKWWAISKNRALFCQEVVRHGYVDEHSGMAFGLTSLGELRYVNLTSAIEMDVNAIRVHFLHNVGKTRSERAVYQVRQAKDMSIAGLTNNWQNYGSVRLSHSLTGDTIEDSSVQVKTRGRYLAINDSISKTVGKARFDYAPIDCGNTHDLYERAYYQNLKQLALFSEKIVLMTYDVTDVQLFDTVVYKQADANPNDPVKNSDVYLVLGKTVFIKGGRTYAEKIVLARMTITTKGITNLKTQDPVNDLQAPLPISIINPTLNTYSNMMNSMRTLSDLVQPARAALEQGIAKYIGLNSSMAMMVPSLARLAALAIDGDPALIAVTMTNMVPGLNQITSLHTEVVNQATSTLNTVTNTLTTLKNLNMSHIVRTNALFLPGGIFNMYSTRFPIMQQQYQLKNILDKVYQDTFRRMTPVQLSELNAVRQTLSTLQSSYISTNVTIWNNLMSVMVNKPIPANPANNQSHFLSSMARAPTLSPKDYSDELKSVMLTTNDDRQYRWMGVISPPYAIVTVDELNQTISSNQDSQVYLTDRSSWA